MSALLRRIIGSFVLPPTISPFEQRYLARANRLVLVFLLLHVPGLTLIAWAPDPKPMVALAL